jgi:acetylornithine/N-succinyldiaminopimelate aminotransferase
MPVASQQLIRSTRFASAKKELLDAVAEASSKLREVRPASEDSEIRQQYAELMQEYSANRGRELYFPFVSSGIGSGPFVELMDGSVKYDLITGIGINFFGHSHPELMAEAVDGLCSDGWQGNLQPGIEAADVLKLLLSKVGAKSKLKHGWLTTCGTMANENAIKMIRQKKAPATKILAFKDCFCGRSTLMAEITDNPGYRQGLPVYGECYYISFYDPHLGLEKSIERSVAEMREHFTRFPGKFCTFMFEIIQGEGGFNYAPRAYYVALFEEAKKAGLAIFADEIQTFGRTGEYFAFQKFDLSEYIDVVTVAKMFQSSVVLFSEEYAPKPGLVAGTFSGPSMQMRMSRKTLELLESGQFLGPEGKIEKLSSHFVKRLKGISEGSGKGKISEIRAIGGMIAFAPFSGTMDQVKKTLMKLFDLGVVAFYCGHGPYLIRMLPPLGAMNESDIDQVCAIIEKALAEVTV